MSTTRPCSADASPSAASRNPISCEPLSPIQESARLPGRRLNGRKPSRAAASATDMTRTRRDGWYHAAAMAKKPAEIAARLAARPSMLSRRLNAFVMPTSHKHADRDRERVPVDELHRRAGREDDRRAAELRRELPARAQRPDVVDQAGHEDQRRRGRDPDQLLARPERPDRDGQPRRRRRRRCRSRCLRGAASRPCASARNRECARARGPTGCRSRSASASAAAGKATPAAMVLTALEGSEPL